MDNKSGLGKFYCLMMSLIVAVSMTACERSPEELAAEALQKHLELAQFYIDEGLLKSSALEIRNALEIDPRSGQAFLLMAEANVAAFNGGAAISALEQAQQHGIEVQDIGLIRSRALLLDSRYQEAIAALDQLEGQYPDDFDAAMLRFDIHLAAEQYDRARQALDGVADASRNKVDYALARAGLALALGDAEAFQAQLVLAEDLDPENQRVWLWKARQAMNQSDFAVAEDAYYRVIRLNDVDILTPIQLEATRGIFRAKIEQDHFAEAQQFYLDFLEIYPDSLFASYEEGLRLAQGGEIEEAIGIFGSLNAGAPTHEPSAVLLGLLKFSQGDMRATEDLLLPLSATSSNPTLLKSLAIAQLRLNKPEQAITVLEAHPDTLASNADLMSVYGMVLFANGDTENGINRLQAAVEMNPDSAELRVNLAGALMDVGRMDASQAQLESALENNREYLPARSLLLFQALLSEDLATATQHADELRDMAALDEAAYRNVFAAIYKAGLESGRTDWAIGWVTDWAEQDPARPEPKQFLADYYNGTGEPEKAQAFAESVLAGNEHDPAATQALADALIAQGDPGKAIEVLVAADKGGEANTGLRLKLASMYLSRNQLVEAQSILNRVLAKQTLNPVALDLAARIALTQQDFDRAGQYRARIETLPGGAARASELAGDILMAQDDAENALTQYQKAWGFAASRRVGFKILSALDRTGDQTKTLSFLAEWVARHPEDNTVRAVFASALLSDGQDDQSIMEYEALLDRGVEDPMVFNNLAWLYDQTGRPGAIELAEKAVALVPENPQVIDTLGWILVRQGQTARGIAELERAAALAPESAEIRAHLEEARTAN